MKKKRIINLLLIFIICVSCRKEADYVAPSGYTNTIDGNFEAFWNGVDQNYVFFEYSTIDWDSMYKVYRPKVDNLIAQSNEDTPATRKALFSIMVSMMKPLIDGHRLLTTKDTLLGSYGINNSDYHNKHTPYPPTVANIEKYCSKLSALSGKYPETDTQYQEIIIGRVDGTGIYYVRINFFGSALADINNGTTFNNFIKDLPQLGYYGLILDVRYNGGGDATAFYNLLSRFVNKDYTWGYSQTRLQRDRYTLSPLVPESVKANGAYFGGQVAILTDRYSFSAAEITTMAMHNLPNVTVIGDTTGGANGPISSSKDFTGSFTIPNGWQVQFAQRVTLDSDKKVFEGKGVPPNIVVKQDGDAYNSGRDNMIEYAINYLSSKQK
jgi:carboxyl-terminal processing protease